MAEIYFEDNEEDIEVQDGELLHQPCEDQGVPFSCTKGTCGTCKIVVNEGMENLTGYTDNEKNVLGEMKKKRLACQCSIKSGKISIEY